MEEIETHSHLLLAKVFDYRLGLNAEGSITVAEKCTVGPLAAGFRCRC